MPIALPVFNKRKTLSLAQKLSLIDETSDDDENQIFKISDSDFDLRSPNNAAFYPSKKTGSLNRKFSSILNQRGNLFVLIKKN